MLAGRLRLVFLLVLGLVVGCGGVPPNEVRVAWLLTLLVYVLYVLGYATRTMQALVLLLVTILIVGFVVLAIVAIFVFYWIVR